MLCCSPTIKRAGEKLTDSVCLSLCCHLFPWFSNPESLPICNFLKDVIKCKLEKFLSNDTNSFTYKVDGSFHMGLAINQKSWIPTGWCQMALFPTPLPHPSNHFWIIQLIKSLTPLQFSIPACHPPIWAGGWNDTCAMTGLQPPWNRAIIQNNSSFPFILAHTSSISFL